MVVFCCENGRWRLMFCKGEKVCFFLFGSARLILLGCFLFVFFFYSLLSTIFPLVFFSLEYLVFFIWSLVFFFLCLGSFSFFLIFISVSFFFFLCMWSSPDFSYIFNSSYPSSLDILMSFSSYLTFFFLKKSLNFLYLFRSLFIHLLVVSLFFFIFYVEK